MEIAYGKWVMGMDVGFGPGSANRGPLNLIKYTKTAGIAYFLSFFRLKNRRKSRKWGKNLKFLTNFTLYGLQNQKKYVTGAVNRQNIQSF